MILIQGCTCDSQPMPSPFLSNPWGSGDKTLKSFPAISSQFKSGGSGLIQKSGYDESQLVEFSYFEPEELESTVKKETRIIIKTIFVINSC